MTQEERRLVAAVAVLVLFGSAVRWFRSQVSEPWTAVELAAIADSTKTAEQAAQTAPAGSPEGEKNTRAMGRDPAPSRIDLNRADASSFDALPGIGKTKALAIVAWRAEHGPFRSPADLDQVPGIGPKTVERLAPLVFCSETAGETGTAGVETPADTTATKENGTNDESGHRGTAAPVGEADPRAVPEGEEAAGVQRGAGG
jgi:competence ComEA-like helix-hairpin-helix protein